jgi:predicted ester cyclase
MADRERKEMLVKRALDEVFSAGNFDVVNEIFHPNFVNHEAGPNTPPGPEGLKLTVGWIRNSFSDLHYEIEDTIAEGDKLAARVKASGRHTGDFIGFAPTGKSFDVQQIHVYRFEGGKIVEHWAARDDLGQGMQLGFIPGGGAAA